MERIRRTFRCISSPTKKVQSLGQTGGRAVFQPIDEATAINGRVFPPDARLMLELPDNAMFTEGRTYQVEIREL